MRFVRGLIAVAALALATGARADDRRVVIPGSAASQGPAPAKHADDAVDLVGPTAAQQARAKAAAEAKAKAEAEAKARAEAETRAKAEAETRAKAEAAARAKAETEAKARAQAEAKARAEAEAKARAEAEAKARAQAEAKAKAASEARARAEAEARARAVAEAKAKTEAEARAKAEAEIRARLAAEAQARAEAEARHKAEAEARVRAEAEAKTRAEAEARAKAELEVRARAESEAKAVAAAKAKTEAEAKLREEIEAHIREQVEAEMKSRTAKTEAEEKARAEKEAKVKARAEAKARKEAEAKARADARAKAKAEAKARREAKRSKKKTQPAGDLPELPSPAQALIAPVPELPTPAAAPVAVAAAPAAAPALAAPVPAEPARAAIIPASAALGLAAATPAEPARAAIIPASAAPAPAEPPRAAIIPASPRSEGTKVAMVAPAPAAVGPVVIRPEPMARTVAVPRDEETRASRRAEIRDDIQVGPQSLILNRLRGAADIVPGSVAGAFSYRLAIDDATALHHGFGLGVESARPAEGAPEGFRWFAGATLLPSASNAYGVNRRVNGQDRLMRDEMGWSGWALAGGASHRFGKSEGYAVAGDVQLQNVSVHYVRNANASGAPIDGDLKQLRLRAAGTATSGRWSGTAQIAAYLQIGDEPGKFRGAPLRGALLEDDLAGLAVAPQSLFARIAGEVELGQTLEARASYGFLSYAGSDWSSSHFLHGELSDRFGRLKAALGFTWQLDNPQTATPGSGLGDYSTLFVTGSIGYMF